METYQQRSTNLACFVIILLLLQRETTLVKLSHVHT